MPKRISANVTVLTKSKSRGLDAMKLTTFDSGFGRLRIFVSSNQPVKV